MPSDSSVPRRERQNAQKWLDLGDQAVFKEDYDLLDKCLAALTQRSGEEPPWLEEILSFADVLVKDEGHILAAVDALLFVADETPCYVERWSRVKASLIHTAIRSNDPEVCMEIFQYLRDREPKTQSGQWETFVDDFLAPFDLSDMDDYLEIFRLTHAENELGPAEEFCRVLSRTLRQAGKAGASVVRPMRPKRGFSRFGRGVCGLAA